MNFKDSCKFVVEESVKPDEALTAFPAIRDVGDLCRLAHIWKFHKDLPPSMRARAIAEYHVSGYVPAYLAEYLERFHL